MYYIYMLRCTDKSLYTGITNNINKRMKNHFAKKGAKYTKSHPPQKVELLYQCKDKKTAATLEYQLKTLTKIQKENLIQRGNIKEYLPVDGRKYKKLELEYHINKEYLGQNKEFKNLGGSQLKNI